MPKGPRGEKRPADVVGAANYVRIHKTLKVTPAMEAGLTDLLWEMADIVSLIDDADVQALVQKRAALLGLPYSN